MDILFQDRRIVVAVKPSGVLSTDEPDGMPALLRQELHTECIRTVHRLDAPVSGLMVFARTPGAAAALSRQITQSQNAYAVQDGRAEGRAEAPCFVKQYRAVLSGGSDGVHAPCSADFPVSNVKFVISISNLSCEIVLFIETKAQNGVQ